MTTMATINSTAASLANDDLHSIHLSDEDTASSATIERINFPEAVDDSLVTRLPIGLKVGRTMTFVGLLVLLSFLFLQFVIIQVPYKSMVSLAKQNTIAMQLQPNWLQAQSSDNGDIATIAFDYPTSPAQQLSPRPVYILTILLAPEAQNLPLAIAALTTCCMIISIVGLLLLERDLSKKYPLRTDQLRKSSFVIVIVTFACASFALALVISIQSTTLRDNSQQLQFLSTATVDSSNNVLYYELNPNDNSSYVPIPSDSLLLGYTDLNGTASIAYCKAPQEITVGKLLRTAMSSSFTLRHPSWNQTKTVKSAYWSSRQSELASLPFASTTSSSNFICIDFQIRLEMALASSVVSMLCMLIVIGVWLLFSIYFLIAHVMIRRNCTSHRKELVNRNVFENNVGDGEEMVIMDPAISDNLRHVPLCRTASAVAGSQLQTGSLAHDVDTESDDMDGDSNIV